jgi:hypothetical protein
VATAFGALGDHEVDPCQLGLLGPRGRADEGEHGDVVGVAGVDEPCRCVERQHHRRRSGGEHDLDLVLHGPRGEHRFDPPQLLAFGVAQRLPTLPHGFPVAGAVVDERGWHQQVDRERLVGGAPDGGDLVVEGVGHVADATEATHAAGLADGGHERRLGDARHARRHDRVVEAEAFGEGGLHVLNLA